MSFGRRLRLIARQEVHDAGELHRLARQPEIVIDDAVEERPELHLDRGRLQSDHAAADDLRREARLADGPHHADRIRGYDAMRSVSGWAAWIARTIGE